ncbi:sensor domain-containing diguanylate cyclase [Saccharibacillus kuerlensis]|uniref:Cell signaling regulator n=1 Tax=Saccharibacillus kuerlensis TaxID=459527 RepID=A0ABQ2KZU0_9BACL|nr:sensor domain-containing diguanylate cyclase [Saccharibacillus kuerlensis]GGN96371.1 cell signaling regulator [Saccharibacillus kuerlensis]
MRKKSKKVRQGIKLSTVIGLLCIFILLSATTIGVVVGYNNDKKALEWQTLRLNEYHADELAYIADTTIFSMQKSLSEAAFYLADRDMTSETIQKSLIFFKNSNSFFNSVVIIDKNALLTYNAPVNLGLTGKTIHTPQLLKALSIQKPYIMSPYVGPSGRYLSTVTHPLYSLDGQYEGIIAGSIYLKEENRLRAILGTQNQKMDGSYFYVVDDQGHYLYHPNEKLIGKSIAAADPALLGLMKEKSGSRKVIERDGKPFLAGHASISQTGWHVIFQTPSENITAFAVQSTFNTSKYLIPSVLLSLVLVFLTANWLSKPLYILARYTENLANRKEQNVPLNVGSWNYESVMLQKAILLAEEKNRQTEEELMREVNHDSLTGLLNRRTLENLTEDWMRQHKKFSVVFLDIDHFKSINDEYGHQQGDEVLKKLGAILSEEVGAHDYCFRYGGEEFVLLLANAEKDEAFFIAERIRKKVKACRMPVPKQVTISLGITLYASEATPQELFHKADMALYRAKETGRNRIVISSLT